MDMVESSVSVNTHVRESLAAAKVLALMGLLASMGADVNCQGAALDEALATARDGASVGALVGVDSVVSLKIRLAVEGLSSVSRERW